MIMKGQKISDRYQVIKSIGEGGMANVFMAYDTILDRNVAIKVLRGDLSNDEKFVRRFQREALAASSLSNPNIVEVYDVGEDHGEYYIVMEYIEGKHLKQLLKKRGKLTVSEAVDIVSQITEGLSVAHDSYIIHRDIKPQNIMILENGLVKITDFGIAMAMNSTQLTQTNSVMGSVHYLPPEQANGKGSTLQSDIYSIGILFYELLTGKLPFKGDNAVEIALKHLKEPLPSIRDDDESIPQSVENIIIKATAKNPKNRYNDAREMHEDLKTCLDKERLNEPKIKLKYQEISDDTKMLKTIKEDKKEDIKKSKKNNDEKVVAKKITGDDLKKQNKTLIKLASIFTGLIIVVTLTFVLVMITSKTGTVAVPDVSNKKVKDAISILQNSGFTVQEENASSKTVKVGRVIKTSPSAGTNKKKGSTIKVIVSTGDATVLIEDYKGQNYLKIQGALEARGLKVDIEFETVDESEEIENEGILRTSPIAGESLKAGERISIVVAKKGAFYPDFVNGSLGEKEFNELCLDYELICDTKTIVTSDESLVGKIYQQSRAAGDPIVKGRDFEITIYVSEGSNPTPNTGEDCIDENGLNIC